jgi:FkbH-like protein
VLDDLLRRLRDLFGKSALSQEDTLRLESIRQRHLTGVEDENREDQSLEFLKQAEAQITFHFAKDPLDPRALELVNKTNQFNLNGRRFTEAAWSQYVRHPDALLMVVGYRDKYGPLGKIAVLTGQTAGNEVILDSWVMSCRAFGRRIEHRCLREVFSRWDVQEVIFNYQETPKNGPIGNFLSTALGKAPSPGCRLGRDQFTRSCGEDVHQVVEVVNG